MTNVLLGPPASHFQVPECPICQHTGTTPFIQGEDDLGGRPGRFTFAKCDNCSLVYQSPRLRFEHIKPYYDEEYIAHRKKSDWGVLTPFYEWAMGKHDREKYSLISQYTNLNSESQVLDVGCGAGTFLAKVAEETGASTCGIDFKDLSVLPWLNDIDFRQGTMAQQDFGDRRFDLITMWHFLEHDYEPKCTLELARELLSPNGKLIVEVPRLDSLSFRMFKDRWPGLQAPQHTMLMDAYSFTNIIEQSGLRVNQHLSYGAFPAYFYFFGGVAFKFLQGRGLNFSTVIYPYFVGQVLTSPFFLLEKRLNLAMQIIVCGRD